MTIDVTSRARPSGARRAQPSRANDTGADPTQQQFDYFWTTAVDSCKKLDSDRANASLLHACRYSAFPGKQLEENPSVSILPGVGERDS